MLHLQQQVSQYPVSWHLCLCFTLEDMQVALWVAYEICHKCVPDVQRWITISLQTPITPIPLFHLWKGTHLRHDPLMPILHEIYKLQGQFLLAHKKYFLCTQPYFLYGDWCTCISLSHLSLQQCQLKRNTLVTWQSVVFSNTLQHIVVLNLKLILLLSECRCSYEHFASGGRMTLRNL